MTDPKETVLVSYSPSLHTSAWLHTQISEFIAPQCKRSVLLIDAPEVHPELQQIWSGEGRDIVQYLKTGHRFINGRAREPKWTSIHDGIDVHDSDRNEIHAVALTLALANAQKQGFSVRTFLVRGHMVDPWHVSHLLEQQQKQLPGTTTVLTPKFPQSVDTSSGIVVWIDTETTGFDRQKCAVIEVAATVTDATATKVLDEFEARAEVPNWALVMGAALEINRYDIDPRWLDKGEHKSMIVRLSEWLPRRFRLGGHNVPFDRGMLEGSFNRYKLAIPDWSETPIDTCDMADRLLKRPGRIAKKSLEAVCEYYGMDRHALHGTRADIDATRAIYLKLCELEKTQVRNVATP